MTGWRTKKWFFLAIQPKNIDVTSTGYQRMKRDGIDSFELRRRSRIYETEHTTKCEPLLMLDVSHSMIPLWRGPITPAKEVAFALSELHQDPLPRIT